MKKTEITEKLHSEMASVHVSPELRARTLAAMRGKEHRTMKRKWTVALAAALIIVATCAVALAAAGRAG
ncbi:MAG: hypothetical protein Q4F18_14615, partial [Clostridia bacterium]|nr:hypothetical protein [Clostridia bacterium]